MTTLYCGNETCIKAIWDEQIKLQAHRNPVSVVKQKVVQGGVTPEGSASKRYWWVGHQGIKVEA